VRLKVRRAGKVSQTLRGTEGKSVKKGVAEKARRIIARKKAEWLNAYAR
jgi:hypothetical protein